jgi:DNA-binding MarR family transcriptional regulator
VMHLYRSRQFQALRDGPHAVTHMDSKVLNFFSHRPGATLSDLAQHSGRDKAQLARLVAGLRERGLLQGSSDPEDRRSVQLTLTAEGQAVQRSLLLQARRLSVRAVTGLDPSEIQQLQSLLQRLRDNLGAEG